MCLLVACKSRAPVPAPAAGSDAAVAVAHDAAVAAAPVDSGLRFEPGTDDGDPGLRIAFAGRVPQLPAISADGQRVASFESSATGMMIPIPFELQVRPFGTERDVVNLETFELVDDAMATAAQDADWQNTAPPADVQQTLARRAAAASKRLQGFTSLTPIELATDGPTKLGDATLHIQNDEHSLEIVLRDASGGVLEKQRIGAFTMGSYETGMAGADAKADCEYRPFVRAAYRTPQALILWLSYGWHELCDVHAGDFLKLALPAPSPERAAIATLLAAQFTLLHDPAAAAKAYQPDAVIIHRDGLGTVERPPFRVASDDEQYTGRHGDVISITPAADGKSAWASVTTMLSIRPEGQPPRDAPWRVSSLLVKTPTGWRIAAASWSEPRDNDTVNRIAKAGSPPFAALANPSRDPELDAAFDALATHGLAPTSRPDLLTLGSAHKERTVGSAALAPAWNAAWKNHLSITSRASHRFGTTGYVVANVLLAKPTYRVPFQLFCIFERTGSTWTLVHLHITA